MLQAFAYVNGLDVILAVEKRFAGGTGQRGLTARQCG